MPKSFAQQNQTNAKLWALRLAPAVLIVLVAQLDLNLIINGFKISMAVILLPVFLFFLEDFRVFPVTLLAAPGVLLLRCAMEWLRGGSILQAAVAFAPEMIFFFFYGALFALYTKSICFKEYHFWYFIPLIGIDLFSNLGELLIRLGSDAFHSGILTSLLVVAVGRSMMAAAILWAFDSYGILLLKKDDRERYKRLLLLISELKSEVVWMNKNTLHIEETMSTSYRLYHQLSETGEDKAAQQALTVAKDVHEIKKEYFLIMRGISSAMEVEMEEKGMWLRSIFQILQESSAREAQSMGKNVKVTAACSSNFYTDKHYFLMSIFRNLLTNSVEAADQEPHLLSLTQGQEGEEIVFRVKDDCGGIPEEYLESIFLPGFSTKISYETGEISRGLGLVLLRDLVEDELGGSVCVTLEEGGSVFTVRVPLRRLA